MTVSCSQLSWDSFKPTAAMRADFKPAVAVLARKNDGKRVTTLGTGWTLLDVEDVQQDKTVAYANMFLLP